MMEESPRVTVVIATFRRQDLLRECIESCFSQTAVHTSWVEILVVDNCPERSAESLVKGLRESAAVDLRYVHEPSPGVSNARNAGILNAHSSLIAFLDDDEAASPDWLANLLACQATHAADVVFGPVLAFVPDTECGHVAYKRALTATLPEEPTGTVVGSSVLTPFWRRGSKAYPSMGAGNVLINKGTPAIQSLRFDPKLGRTGGEDTLFFNQALQNGARMVWCAEALATERVEPNRLNFHYLARRAFRSGQLVSWVPLLVQPRRTHITILSVTIAAIQVPLFAIVAATSAILRSPRRIQHGVRLSGALGRLFWSSTFRFDSYGLAPEEFTGSKSP